MRTPTKAVFDLRAEAYVVWYVSLDWWASFIPGFDQLVTGEPAITRPPSLDDRNEGTVDRAARIVLGLALLSLVFVGPQTWIGLFGVVPLVTGLVGFCPLYGLLGVRTRKMPA